MAAGISSQALSKTSPAFNAQLRFGDHQAIVHVAGAVDLATAGKVRDAVDVGLSTEDRIVFDLAETTFMDWAGLSPIMEARTTLGTNAAVRIRSASADIRRLLCCSGCDSLLTVED